MTIRAVEILVAALLFAIAALVIHDSLRVGASWASDGPQAGYFPFYIGIILALSSVWILLANARRVDTRAFVGGEEFKRVIAVLVPAVLYVAAIGVIGLYLASALFIAFFMLWHGKFSALLTVIVSTLIPLTLFLLFEVWFLVPLPKGPLESLFGY